MVSEAFKKIITALLRYSSHKVYSFRVYNSLVSGVFTGLCHHPHCLISEHFHHPPKKILYQLAAILHPYLHTPTFST